MSQNVANEANIYKRQEMFCDKANDLCMYIKQGKHAIHFTNIQ